MCSFLLDGEEVRNQCLLTFFAYCNSRKIYGLFQQVLCLLRLSKTIFSFFSAGTLPAADKISFMRFFQRVLCLLRLNKIIVTFFSAGILPAADKIKVICVSFSGCFACCGSIKHLGSFQRVLCLLRPKDLYAFLSAGPLPAAPQ